MAGNIIAPPYGGESLLTDAMMLIVSALSWMNRSMNPFTRLMNSSCNASFQDKEEQNLCRISSMEAIPGQRVGLHLPTVKVRKM